MPPPAPTPIPKRRAVFLDRDGTLIPDHGYLATVEGVNLLPGAGEALRRLHDAGFLLVLVTNQSGIGRGYFSRELLHAQHERLQELLTPHGVPLAAIDYCPHLAADACDCRKPQPGMLRRAAAALALDLRHSFMVGDKESDVAAGHAAGCRAVRIGEPGTATAAETLAADLAAAAAAILAAAGPDLP
ncbi:MAG: HAD family hydrolase [Lentisphaeria bacterium]|jgi:D-glycero-D-manno-heptose 1,7-bisphosphate phosphatase